MRQAFLKTIPRQEIIDRLIVPLNPTPTLRNSFTAVPGAPGYDDLVASNGSADYAEVDIEGPRRCSTEAGVTVADRRPVPVRRQQPPARQRVRADPRLGGRRPAST